MKRLDPIYNKIAKSWYIEKKFVLYKYLESYVLIQLLQYLLFLKSNKTSKQSTNPNSKLDINLILAIGIDIDINIDISYWY